MRFDTLISTSDRLMKGMEDKTVKSLQASLDTAFTALEGKLNKLYTQAVEDINTSAAFRLQKLVGELGGVLELIDPRSAASYQTRLQQLIEAGQERGINLSQDILQRFEPSLGSLSIRVDVEAAAFAAQNAFARLRNHSEAFRQQAIQIIGYNLAVGSGALKTARQLRDTFGLVKYRAEAIARTETLAALNEAADRVYQEQEVDYVQWFATADERTCKYCGFRNQRIYKRTEVKVPTHVSCRCFLTPIKPKWLEKGLVDLEWANQYHREAGEKVIGSDSGVSPFERAAGVTSAPKPVWNPGEPAPKLAQTSSSPRPPRKTAAEKAAEEARRKEAIAAQAQAEALEKKRQAQEALQLATQQAEQAAREKQQATNAKVFAQLSGNLKGKKIEKDLATWEKEYDLIETVTQYNRQLRKLESAAPDADTAELRETVAYLRKKIPDDSPYLKAEPLSLADNYSIGSAIVASQGEKKIGIYDDKGNIQAAVVYQVQKKPEDGSKPHLYIDYLATAPWNLTEDARTVKGAGTRSIVEAVELSQAKGLEGRIKLDPLKQAKAFYAKLGFEPEKSDGTGNWILSPEKAQALLDKLKTP